MSLLLCRGSLVVAYDRADAAVLGVVLRTVERKLYTIRERWSGEDER